MPFADVFVAVPSDQAGVDGIGGNVAEYLERQNGCPLRLYTPMAARRSWMVLIGSWLPYISTIICMMGPSVSCGSRDGRLLILARFQP